jgi:NTE family protein
VTGTPRDDRPIAFVLGGGGRLGAAEVGMLEALVDAGIRPDRIYGTSIGAINGAVFASSPDVVGVARLREVWSGLERSGLLSGRLSERLRTLASTRVALHRPIDLAAMLETVIAPDADFSELEIDFSCVAACIETASAVWFERGPLIPALLASSAVPGLFEPVEVNGRNYFDGGLVDSIPVRRAVQEGAGTVYVLQVGRIEQPLEVPSNLVRVAQVSFEIARRHGFATFMEDIPDTVAVHVLPSGGNSPTPTDLRANLTYRDTSGISTSIDDARDASLTYLADVMTSGR